MSQTNTSAPSTPLPSFKPSLLRFCSVGLVYARGQICTFSAPSSASLLVPVRASSSVPWQASPKTRGRWERDSAWWQRFVRLEHRLDRRREQLSSITWEDSTWEHNSG